jgi:hypothetical protein
MSTNDEFKVKRSDMSSLEKIRSQGKRGKVTINPNTGEITHSFTSESPSLSDDAPEQGIGIYDPDTGKVERHFFFGNVPKPVRGEVYRWHSEFDPYMMYYVEYKSWFTSVEQEAHIIVCPGFDFRFKGRTRCNLYLIQQSVKHPITPRLGMIHDENERSMAKALFKLAHKAWPTSTRGQFELTKHGIAVPRATVDWKGVDKWRVVACSLWLRWQTDKDSWEARAADIRELCPGVKMTAERLRRECAKDRLGLLA